MRYFGQSPDYWLDSCTLADWTRIYSRELHECPPPETFLAAYFEYDPPARTGDDDAAAREPEIWECELPEMTE